MGKRGARGARIAIVIASALAACDSGGMEILVYGPADPGTPAPHTVKLFIGLGDPTMATIAPAPGNGPRFTAQRWDRDPANADDSAEYGDGPARFLFRGGGGIDKFGAVVAVGYDAAGAPTSSELLLGPEMGNAHLMVYRMGLNAFTNPITKRTGYNSLELWGPTSGNVIDDACVFVQNTYAGPTSSSAFITTPGDRDCDGIPDSPTPPECDANAWNGHTTIRSDLSCLAQDSLGQGSNAAFCLLGGPQCKDGIGPDGSCTASKYCTHPDVCGRCGLGRNAWNCATDFRATPGGGGGGPMIQCDIPLMQGSNGQLQLCNADQTFPLTSLLLPPGVKCTHVQIRNTTQNFADKLVDQMTATFSVETDDACMLTVNGGGGYGSATLPQGAGGLIAVDFSSSQHGIAYPIEFNFITLGPCAPGQCRLVGEATDQFLQCVPAAPP